MKNKILPIFLFVFTAFLFGHQAKAATKEWLANAPGDLASVATNWASGVLPSSGDDLVFPSGATVVWDISGVMPRNVTTQANVSLKAPLALMGDFKVSGGKLLSNSNAISVGGAVILSGGAADFGASSINVSGDWKFSGGTAVLSSATVSFTGSGDKLIYSSGNSFGKLSINAPGVTVKLADDFESNDKITVSDGIFSLAGKTMTLTGGLDLIGGTVTLSGGKINFVGTKGKPFSISGGSFNVDAGGTVVYAPTAGSITVAAADYYDLELSGNAVFSLSGGTTVNGKLIIGVGATLSPSSFTISAKGQVENSGKILGDKGIDTAVGSIKFINDNFAEIFSFTKSSGVVRVSIENIGKNFIGSVAETLAGLTLTTMSGDKEIINAVETSNSTGVFVTPAIVVHEAAVEQGNGQLEVSQNDIIFATYVDPQNSARKKSAEITVSATTSSNTGIPQIVAKPILTNWSSVTSSSGTTYSAHIIWETDIVSSSAITVSGGSFSLPVSAGSLTPTLTHDVLVSGLSRGYVYSYKVSSMSADGKSVTSDSAKFTVIVAGDRIKTANSSAVYWYLNGKRNVFSNFFVYDSWFPDFKNVVTIPAEQMSDILIGRGIPVRAGTYLVKIQSDPRVYAVLPFGKLSWVQTETQAIALYGENWSKRVIDMDVAFFGSYSYADPMVDGKMPDGFVYSAGGENGIYLENSLHRLNDAALPVNGIDKRFISPVVLSMITNATNGGIYYGYAPAANTVFKDGNSEVVAPARIEK